MLCPKCQEPHTRSSRLCMACELSIIRKEREKRRAMKRARNSKGRYLRGYHAGIYRLPRGTAKRATDEEILLYFDAGIALYKLSYYLSVPIPKAQEIICASWKTADDKHIRRRRMAMCKKL